MRLTGTIFLFIFVISTVSAQFGISVRYQDNRNKVWQDLADTQFLVMDNSVAFGANYWFRLKNQRIEFLPEVTYAFGDDRISKPGQPNSFIRGERATLSFIFNTQIYPLDFNNDCNCPTFSKDGSFFTKGFYWLINPGVALSKMKTTYENGSEEVYSDPGNTLVGKLGLGAGIDFGIGDIITVSPFILYNVIFNHPWDVLPEALELPDNEMLESDSNIAQLNFGLRIMFRPDYVKNKRF